MRRPRSSCPCCAAARARPGGLAAGTVRTSDGAPLPHVVLIAATGRPARAPSSPVPRAATARRPGRRAPTPSPSERPGFVLEPARARSRWPTARAASTCAWRPRPCASRSWSTATRGEAAAVHAGRRASPSSTASGSRSAQPSSLAAAAAGPARGRGGAHRRRRAPGLGLRARRRVALRARPRGRRARQPAGRRLRLRQRAAAGAGARRGRARRGQQPLRHRRAGRRHPPRDAARGTGAGPRAARGGRRRQLRLAPRARAATSGRVRAPATGTRACVRLEHRQRSSPTARSRRRRARRRWACASASARSCASSLRAEDSERGTPGPDRVRPARPRRVLRAHGPDVARRAPAARARPRRPRPARRARAAPRSSRVNPLDSGPYVPRCGRRGRLVRALRLPRTRSASRTTPTALLARLPGRGPGRAAPPADRAASTWSTRAGELGSRADELLSPTRTNVGVYLQDRVVLGDRVFVTAGRARRAQRQLRHEGRAAGGGGLCACAAASDATTLRASAGAGIKEPSFFESFGVVVLRPGQPGPEAGAQPHLRRRASSSGCSAAACAPRRRSSTTTTCDQIAFTRRGLRDLPGHLREPRARRARAALELALEAAPAPRAAAVRAQYTLLDGEVLVSPQRLRSRVRRGRAAAAPAPRTRARSPCAAGAARGDVGATLVARRAARGQRLRRASASRRTRATRASTRARACARGARLEAFVVGENLLDREYQEALGYPALGPRRCGPGCASARGQP